MDLKTFAMVFGTVFLAELGDKTQLATLLFASDPDRSLWWVFAAASIALIAATLLAVLVGSRLPSLLDPHKLAILAGVGFIVIGAWTIVGAVKG